MKRILVTGGGSGGHVNTAKAFVDKLMREYGERSVLENILYIGGNKGMAGDPSSLSLEQKIIEQNTQIPFKAVSAGKLQRKPDLTTLTMPFEVTKGFLQSLKLIKQFRPDLVFATGGYVTVPVCMAARALRVPVYLHEQTASVGLANKIVAKFAKKVFVSFASSLDEFPKDKVVLSGHLIRRSIFDVSLTQQAKLAHKLKSQLDKVGDVPVVTLIGGGQGSHKLNTVFLQTLPKLLGKYFLILQTGDNSATGDFDKLTKRVEALPEFMRDNVLITKFVHEADFGYIMAKTDIFVGRSGAGLVYEMALLRKPSILVPIPWVTHNEQMKNAQNLVDVGLAKVIEESDLNPGTLTATIDSMNEAIKKQTLPIDEDALQNLFPDNGAEIVFHEIFG